MARPFDWAQFEDNLHEELGWGLEQLGKRHRRETFYVVALYGVYRELDSVLSLPHLGANTTDAGAPNDDGDFWGERWSPADWQHQEIPTRRRPTLRLEKALTREATSSTQQHWRKVETRYFNLLVRLARKLRDLAPEVLRVTDDFVAFVCDDEGGPELARKTIPRRRFEVLFSQTVHDARNRAAVAEQSPSEQAAFLVTRFSCFEGVTTEDAQRQLMRLGGTAVPHLVGALGDEKNGWVAARLLGAIGDASDEVIVALRRGAMGGSWHARALGVLGDNAWLAHAGPGAAVTGLTAPLLAIATRDRTPPLSYRALESYLDTHRSAGDEVRTHVEKELKPGSAYAALHQEGVDEALRGLSSGHAVIRWHAASLLGNRGLGKKAGERILPALAASLGDEHPLVRRLAVLAIGRWKAASKPHRAQIAQLADDPDESVRKVVAHVLKA